MPNFARKFITLAGAALVFYGCHAAPQDFESAKTAQAFNTEITGNYLFAASECENIANETSIAVSNSVIRFGETVCQFDMLGMSEKPYGFQLDLKSCESGAGEEPGGVIIVEGIDGGIRIHETSGSSSDYKTCAAPKE